MARHKRPHRDRGARPKPLTLVVLQRAIEEGHDELNDGEYWHCVAILKKLRWFRDAAKCAQLKIKPIDGIFELSERGGLLGKKNIRFYFKTIDEMDELVVLKTYRKDEEDQTPRHVIINAKTRLGQYKRGLVAVGAIYRRK